MERLSVTERRSRKRHVGWIILFLVFTPWLSLAAGIMLGMLSS